MIMVNGVYWLSHSIIYLSILYKKTWNHQRSFCLEMQPHKYPTMIELLQMAHDKLQDILVISEYKSMVVCRAMA